MHLGFDAASMAGQWEASILLDSHRCPSLSMTFTADGFSLFLVGFVILINGFLDFWIWVG